jgi:hypothetical protein
MAFVFNCPIKQKSLKEVESKHGIYALSGVGCPVKAKINWTLHTTQSPIIKRYANYT